MAKYKDQYTIVNAQAILATELSERPYQLLAEKDGHVFVFNKRFFDPSIQEENCSSIADVLVKVKSNETCLLTVYDLFTGEQLLPYEYERVYYAAGYLYVYREGSRRTNITEDTTGKQGIWRAIMRKYIGGDSSTDVFLLVEAQPQSPETQDKSCGYAILKSLYADNLTLLRFFFFFGVGDFHIQYPINISFGGL